MAKLKRTLVYPDGFGTYDVEADDEAGLQEGINDIDQQFETHTKAKRNLAELTAAPVDRKRGLYAGADPTTEEPDLRGSGVGAAFEAGGQAFQRGVGRVAGNLAAVPSALDRAVDDAGEFIVGGGLTGSPQPLDPFDGQPVKKGVPLYAGKRILDTPQTSGGPAMLSGVADDLRHGLPEMPSGYSQALAKKNLWEKVQDPTWYADMLAGNAPQMGVSLAGGALGGRAGSAAASSAMMIGDEFQRTQDFEEETGRRADGAGAKALLSGGLQGALDSIVPGSIAAGGVKQEIGALIGTVLKEGGTEALQKLISDAISPAEQRSFGDRMTDPKYLMDLAEEGVAGGIMGGAMHPLGQSGLRPTQPNSQTLKRTSPADIIEGRDGATGMQPVDMKVPVEKGPSAAVAPNPDRSARIIPVGAPVPDGMARMTVDGGVLIYDRATNPSFAATRDQVSTPEGLAAFLEANGTPAASGQPSTTNAALYPQPPVTPREEAERKAAAELRAKVAAEEEFARAAAQRAAEAGPATPEPGAALRDPFRAPAPPKLDGSDLYIAAKAKLEANEARIRSAVDATPEQKEAETFAAREAYRSEVAALDAKYNPQPPQPSYFDSLPPEGIRITPEQRRAAERSRIMGDATLTPEQKDELLARVSAADAAAEPLGQPSFFDSFEGVTATPEQRAQNARDSIVANPTIAPEQKEEMLARLSAAISEPSGQRSYFDTLPPGGVRMTEAQRAEQMRRVDEAAKKEAEAATAPKAEPKKEGLAERKARERADAEAKKPKAEPKAEPKPVAKEAPVAQSVQQPKAEPKVTTPVADQKAAAAFTPVQLKQAEQLVKLAYHSEKTADGPTERTRAEREVEREEKRAREMGIDVDAISRSVGREPTGSDGNALPTVAKVVPESAEVTPQVTAETSPFMQARRAAEAAAAKEVTPGPKPEPKPVAKAPAKKTLGSETNAEYKARILATKEAKAAADAAKAKPAPVSDRVVATIPAPKTPEVVAAEKAEREAAKTAQPMMDRVAETRAKAGRSDASRAETNRVRLANVGSALLVVREAEAKLAAASAADKKAAAKSALAEAKKTLTVIKNQARAAGVTAGEIEAFIATKTPEPDTPKTVEKKLAAAVAKEKALRAKRDADPENEALLDEYNEATAELYALTKEANGKGVSTLAVTTDDDTPSLMKTIPQREARAEVFGNKQPMTREAFDKALEDAKKRLPGIAHLVDALNSQADLPASVAAVANGDRIDGFTQNGRVAVVADGMTSPEHVAATLAHEAVGHLVPEAVFGKNEWRKRLNDMMASSQWFRDFVANFGKSEIGSRYKAAELASEAVAFEANKVLDDANYKPPNAYRMFIAKLREWLREAVGARRVIGLSKVLEFSDRDLAAFIARSKRTAETGLPKNRRKGDGKPSFAKAVPGAAEPVATAYSEADLIDVPPIEGFDRVRRAMEDDMLALRRAEDAADKRGTSREEISMYKASDERHGKAATEIQDVRSQFVTPIIKMAHKAGVTLDEIGDWLYAVHAISRNAEGRKRDPGNPEPFSGMSDADARAKLVALEPKAEALNEIAEVVYAMLAYERKRIVEAGLATKEEVEGWRKTWGSTYVPLRHQEMDEARSGNARGYNVLRRAAKQATGRRTEADNPLFSAISQVQRSITRAHNAEVGRQFDLFVQANPNPEYWIRNPKPKTKTLKTKENEDGELETKVVTVAEPTFMRDDILHVKDKDGNDVEIQILHPDVLRAMTRAMSGLGNSNAEKAVAFASAFTRIYGGLLTQYNLEFLISNPARDVQGAAANIAVGYGQSTDKSGRKKSQIVKTAAKVIGQYGRSAKGIVQFMRDPDSKDEYAQLYAQMRREGATVGWAPFEDPNKIKNQIQSDMNSLKRGALHPKEWLKKANEAIHAANTIAENATRLSVYKTLGDLGITGRERVRITKNSTVNFNRRGEYGPIFNAAYMFGQVGVGAPAAMLGFVKRSPKRAAQVAATLAMAGWAEGFLNILFAGDDDDDGYSNYEELMESEKSRNWIFGKKKFPLGHGWSFFVNFGRHVAETQFGPREIKDLPGATFTNLMDSFNPLGASADPVQAAMPWFLDPMVQHYGNKTTFGAPIYPPDPAPGQPTVPDSRRHFRSAPKWATSAAEGLSTITGGDGVKEGLIEVSPETLQFYYDFATQGAVKLMTRTLAAAHNAATGTETRTSDIPFVRRLATSEHPSVDRGRYIRQKQELTDAYDRAKKYKGLGPKGETDKNLDRYNELLAGPLRSRSDFMKLDKLYAQLDDAEGPEVDALKKRVIAVAGRQYELSKKVDKYIPLEEGLLGDLEEKVEALSPKKEKVEAKEEIEEDLENR